MVWTDWFGFLETFKIIFAWDYISKIPNILDILPYFTALVLLGGYAIIYYLKKTPYSGIGRNTNFDLHLDSSYDNVVGPLFLSVPIILAALLLGLFFTFSYAFLIVDLAFVLAALNLNENLLSGMAQIPPFVLFYSAFLLSIVILVYFFIIPQTIKNFRVLHNAWVILVKAWWFFVGTLSFSVILFLSIVAAFFIIKATEIEVLLLSLVALLFIWFGIALTKISAKNFRGAKFLTSKPD
ncbi:MAG: hypothetical protein V1676_06990 [Candidatus Diapherotrites archaeon]